MAVLIQGRLCLGKETTVLDGRGQHTGYLHKQLFITLGKGFGLQGSDIERADSNTTGNQRRIHARPHSTHRWFITIGLHKESLCYNGAFNVGAAHQ